ncbi:uncharacterized protein LOC143222053 isoform X3 [Tachypleus tridentatus]
MTTVEESFLLVPKIIDSKVSIIDFLSPEKTGNVEMSGLDFETLQKLLISDENKFEEAINRMNIRELLDLVTGLQNAMAKEQEHFDQLSAQLQINLDTTSQEHQRISSDMCTSQMKLALLCTRNMRCFTQQAIRAKQDQLLITRSGSSEDLTLDKPTGTKTVTRQQVTGIPANNHPSNQASGFQNNFHCYQNKVTKNLNTEEKKQLPAVPSISRTEIVVRGPLENHVNKSGTYCINSAPSVDIDDTLESVKLIRAGQVCEEGNTSVNDSEDQSKDNSSSREPLKVSKHSFKITPLAVLQKRNQPDSTKSSSNKYHNTKEQDVAIGESPERRIEMESDLDSQDFVVHNNTFYGQDIEEGLLNETYNLVSEDGNEPEDHVQHHDIQVTPHTPSPDYSSSEDEYDVISGTNDERDPFYNEEDNDFIDDSASFLTDPRHYLYYSDDKELEVIPEEDEDDFEDEDMDTLDFYRGNSYEHDILKRSSHEECDSGVADGHPSSLAEEEDSDKGGRSSRDTDSAQGSFLPDSNSGSPPVPEKPIYRSSIQEFVLQPPQSLESQMTDNNVNEHFHLEKSNECSLKKLISSNGKVEQDQSEGILLSGASRITGSIPDVVEDTRRPRSSTINWDPTDLLMELYKLAFHSEDVQENTEYINIEGYLEKLPSGRKKVTYWNPWKLKYFCAKDGFLYSYDSIQSEKPSQKLQLMGGVIEVLDSNVIGIDDKKGHYVVVRCHNEEETDDWLQSLQTQCRENFHMTFIQPVKYPMKCHKDVIIVDLGSCSIRAGILMDHPTLPQVFFPTVCATNKHYSKKQVFGIEALKPNVRFCSNLSFPVSPSAKITKYNMDVEKLSGIFKKVFQELNVDPRKYKVQVCVPRSFSIQTQIAILKTLFEEFGVKGINLTHQAILALYAYNTTSGIVVDIGDRMDIIPITHGYIVESGITRLPYGGQRILHHLRHALSQKHVSLISDIEAYMIRYIQEKACFVSQDYKKDLERSRQNPESIEKTIPVKQFFQPECPWETISLDVGRFQTPEGLFTPELWGLDCPGIHKLILRAFHECSMDIRREMVRSIYLSGGVTLLPGFAERLEREVNNLTPSAIVPKVHASPYRYHMAYLGACQLAASDGFEEACASADEWSEKGSECLKRWHL